MIEDLLDRGCVLNVHELKQLPLLYIENAMKDNQVDLNRGNENTDMHGNHCGEIERVTNVIQLCKMNPASICDELQNNPLHLYKKKHQNTNKDEHKDENKDENKDEQKSEEKGEENDEEKEEERMIYSNLKITMVSNY